MTRTYNEPIKFNRNPVTSNRKLRSFGKKLFFSLGVPVTFTIIALMISYWGGQEPSPLLFHFDNIDYLKTSLTGFLKTILLTLTAACALNANLNSGRMDFSLGATGILGSVIAAQILTQGGTVMISTIGGVFSFMFLTMAFSMLLGLVNSIIFITLKIPPIVMSLGMCLVFEGIAKVIIGEGTTFTAFEGVIPTKIFEEPVVLVPMIAIVMVIMSLILCYSKFGYEKNALVYDQKISVETGIKEVASCVACFIIAGALIGIYQTVNCMTGTDITIKVDLGSSGDVFKNFLPIFIGGIIAKYNNQIVGLTLAIFSTSILTIGMNNANEAGSAFFTTQTINLINGFMVFGVLVYMVNKNRFINWVKMRKYLHTQKRLYPDGKED